jgi:hypothetical protein
VEVVTMKPKLTRAVLEGLSVLAGIVEAGSSDDVLGISEEGMDAEMRKTWHEVLRACEWVRRMQSYREGGGKPP